MDKFAFIVHPYDIDIFADKVISEQSLKTKNRRFAERALRLFPPFKRDTVMIKSLTGKIAEGEIIIVPLIAEQILYMDKNIVLKKVIEAGKLAQKLGAKIIGLGAYLSNVGKKGLLISEALGIPVTTGISYTIAISIEATLKAARAVGINLNKANVTIVGATGSIGKICSIVLSRQVASITLVARNQERLKDLAESIHSTSEQSNIKFSTNLKNAIMNSDIIMVSTNSPSTLINPRDLQPGCIVCDISVPHNISSTDVEQNSILVIDGGLVKCPSEVNFHYLELPPNLSYACLAEVMTLTLEGLYQSYSIGGNISTNKVVEINNLATKHGFKVADFKSFGKQVSDNQIEQIKNIRMKKQGEFSVISTSY